MRMVVVVVVEQKQREPSEKRRRVPVYKMKKAKNNERVEDV